jgi:hypothetical protein
MAQVAQAQQDPRNLHVLAVDVQTDLHKLAVGLAHAGAEPKAVAQLTQMAGVIGQVVKVLGEGPPLDGGQAEPAPGQAQPPDAAAPQGPPEGAPPAAPTQPAAGAPPTQPQATPEQHSMASATHALHAAMIASAQSRKPQ